MGVSRLFPSLVLVATVAVTSCQSKEPKPDSDVQEQPTPTASPTPETNAPLIDPQDAEKPDFLKPSTDSSGEIEYPVPDNPGAIPVMPRARLNALATPVPCKCPTPTPKPTATPTPKPSPKPTATPTPKPTASPTPKASPTATPKPSPTPMPKPTPVASTTFKTNVYGGTETQRARLMKIARNTEVVINSARFKERLLDNVYKEKAGFFGTTASPESVYRAMMESDEFLKGVKDFIWQYELYIEVLPEGVYGRMYWPKDPIYFNSLYLDNRLESGLAGTYCHEKSHQLGYTHTKERTDDRPYSVPYVLGTICAEVYKEMF
jgi:hypothetical protein